MNFITIDFETATAERENPFEIGLTFVQDSKVMDTKSWLINQCSIPTLTRLTFIFTAYDQKMLRTNLSSINLGQRKINHF